VAASTATGPASRRLSSTRGRDLAGTTDYRTALAVILERHLRLVDRQLTQVFPGLPSRHGPTWGRCW
jgi:hypothetical protein